MSDSSPMPQLNTVPLPRSSLLENGEAINMWRNLLYCLPRRLMSGLNLTQRAFRFGTCALLCLLGPTSATAAALPATRPNTQSLLHVPDDPSQAKAERMVREVYAKEYATSDPAARRALAGRMLRQAMDSGNDAAARFVLLREARDIAASAGD